MQAKGKKPQQIEEEKENDDDAEMPVAVDEALFEAGDDEDLEVVDFD